MLRRALLVMVFCVGLAVAGANLRAPVRAVDTSNVDYKIHQSEVDAYYEAVQDCSTPSLECLVRNTTRFVAMEWVNDIAGETNKFEASTGTPTPVASGRSGGLIASVSNLMAQMYAYPPANTGRYVADVLDNAGIASPAYAQGLGFASLDPILGLWKLFRNVAYFFFIAVIIIIGIMIMLRQKISAQASVTAQQALPSIIVSLVLVTFSYAIAGLLIDIMYVSMFLIAGLFDTVTTKSGESLVTLNIFELGGMLFTNGVGLNGIGNNVNAVTEIISSLGQGDGISNFLGMLGGLTISIIVAIAVLIGLVKLFFELLKSYASIIMSVVFAPLYLMIGAFPGKNAFGPWVKNLIGNLAAFPTVLLFVIMFVVFTDQVGVSGQGGFMPPYLIGDGQGNLAGYVIGLAILLALPEIVKDIKKKMGAGDGGFGLMAAGAAFSRGKEAWNKGTFGVSGKNVVSGAMAVGGAGAGSLIGGTITRMRGGSFGEGARTGAFYGGAVPIAARAAPGLIKDTYGVIKSETSEMAAEEIFGGITERAARSRGVVGAKGQELLSRVLQSRGIQRRQPQNKGGSGPGTNTGGGGG